MADWEKHREILERDLDAFRKAERTISGELRKPLRDRDCESVHWWMHRLAQLAGSIRTNERRLRMDAPSDPVLDRAGSTHATMKVLRQKVGDKCVKAI